jgi:hypothetical protein
MNRVQYRQVALSVTHAELFTIFLPRFELRTTTASESENYPDDHHNAQ